MVAWSGPYWIYYRSASAGLLSQPSHFFHGSSRSVFFGLLIPPGVDGACSALDADNSPEKRLWGVGVAFTALGLAQVCLVLILFPFLVGIMRLVWR